jgi:hypothetical protein
MPVKDRWIPENFSIPPPNTITDGGASHSLLFFCRALFGLRIGFGQANPEYHVQDQANAKG